MSRLTSSPPTWLLVLVVPLVAVACRVADPSHCANRSDAEGRTDHAWCMAEHELPYCDRCRPSSDRGGCSATLPSPSECLPREPPEDEIGSSGTTDGTGDTATVACEPDGPHDECAAMDPVASFCVEGQCGPCDDALCPDGACDPRPGMGCAACRPDAESQCPAPTPWCGPELACTDACTRHEHCPESACDLGTGSCIPGHGAVAWVDGDLEPAEAPSDPSQCRSIAGADWRSGPITYCDLPTALADAPNPAVIRVRPAQDAYRGVLSIEEQRTVAIVAEPGDARVPVRLSSTIDPFVVQMLASSRVYLQGLALRGVGELGAGAVGVECQGASGQITELWLDDVEISRVHTGVRTDGCTVTVRRASIHGNHGIGVDVTGRSVTLESSVVAENAGVGLRIDGTSAYVRFSSVLDNDQAGAADNVACVGTAQGRAEGSIIVHPDALGLSIACSNAAFFLERTVTDDVVRDRYRTLSELFSDLPTGALRDPDQNPIVELGAVTWELGDPYFDIDGQPRPAASRLRVAPGANEP